MKHLLISGVLAAFCATFCMSQSLPRGLSDDEKQWIAEGLFRKSTVVPGALISLEPPESPRSMAEWEEQQALVITWTGYPSILREIVRYAKEEATVLIVTTNESAVRSDLEDHGIDLSDHVEFIQADYNTIWIRDYGGNPVYTRGVDSLVLVDWIYNRPRPKDDMIPFAVAEYLNVPVHSTGAAPYDLVNTGGNFMSDGMGRGFSSELVLMENGPNNVFGQSDHDESAIDEIMDLYMGVDEYVKMPVLPYDGIHHIDMHMKLLDESTLLVGKYPEGVADGPQIEANLLYVIEKFKQQTGRDYKVVRIPMPPDQFGRYPHQGGYYRTYANAIFVNRTILVPVYEERYDTTALRIWEDLMPGYRIVGINCNSIIPAGGALHCITKEVGVSEPLWIAHFQPEIANQDTTVALQAHIRHVSGITSAYLFFRASGNTTYDSVEMFLVDQGDKYSAELPLFTENTTVEYYFKATANTGKTVTRPLTAPEGFFRLEVISDSTTSAYEDRSADISLRLFPNPAGAITCIEMTSPNASTGWLEIVDVHGRKVKTLFSGAFATGFERYFFDASTFLPGMYFLRMQSSDFQTVVPFVVK